MNFPVKKILILVAILALPGFLYYLLQEKGKNRYKPLEFYGPKEVAGTFHTFHGTKIPDTIYHRVRNFTLVNQDGKPQLFSRDTGIIKVVCFFYRNARMATTMIRSLDRLATEYQHNKRLRFIAITVDSRRDSVGSLKALALRFHSRRKRWDFLTGADTLVYRLAKEDFLVDAFRDTTSATNFITSPMLILVDPKSRIRGFYDATSSTRMAMLSDEIKVQIAEELRKIKGAN